MGHQIAFWAFWFCVFVLSLIGAYWYMPREFRPEFRSIIKKDLLK